MIGSFYNKSREGKLGFPCGHNGTEQRLSSRTSMDAIGTTGSGRLQYRDGAPNVCNSLYVSNSKSLDVMNLVTKKKKRHYQKYRKMDDI